MTDLSATIAPKSDQLNADDLIAGPVTIRVTKISANTSSPEQPISVFYEGDNGKPYKPCKSMRRVLVHLWGKDGNTFPGRAMTLYRDPTVKFGGFETGGIRISHVSHITEPVTMALTATRASRKPYTVQPLLLREVKDTAAARSAAQKGTAAFTQWWKSASADERVAATEIKDELTRLREAADKNASAQNPASDFPAQAEAGGVDSSDGNPGPSEESEPIDAPTAFEMGRTARASGKIGIFDVPDDIKAAGQTDAWKEGWNKEDLEQRESSSQATSKGA